MTNKKKRILTLVIGALSMAFGAYLILTSLEENLLYFYSPSDVIKKGIEENKEMRVGGMVKENSIQKKGLMTSFTITDFKHEIRVEFSGIVPALFREGQGVIAEGSFKEKPKTLFTAHRILAKHDENYMPPEVKKSLQHN